MGRGATKKTGDAIGVVIGCTALGDLVPVVISAVGIVIAKAAIFDEAATTAAAAAATTHSNGFDPPTAGITAVLG